jgi:hypothetical protein
VHPAPVARTGRALPGWPCLSLEQFGVAGVAPIQQAVAEGVLAGQGLVSACGRQPGGALPKHPQPVPPIYQPEVAARGVVFAADHPRRRQYWVGGTTAATIVANRLAPALLDRYLARTGYGSQQTAQRVEPGRPDNLVQPVDGTHGHDHGSRGAFDSRSHQRSPQLWISQHARLSSGAVAGAVVLGSFLAGWLGRHR